MGLAHQGDDGLQIVAALAGNAHLISLNRRLHFDLALLDQLAEFFCHFLLDTLLEFHRNTVGFAGVNHFAHVHGVHIHIALDELVAQHVDHLLQLKIRLSGQFGLLLGPLKAGFHAAKIKTGFQLALGVLHRVAHFLHIHFGNYVK